MTPGDRPTHPNRIDKLEAIAGRFLEAFRTGELPAKLAKIYLTMPDPRIPCRRWSVRNQCITVLHGHDDARGFHQWLDAGRHVTKGASAFYILNPIVPHAERRREKKAEDDAQADTPANAVRAAPRGFRYQAVFGYDQTEGEPLPQYEEQRRKVEALPLVEVARSWNLEVRPQARALERNAAGTYVPGKRITLAVENLATWAHELIHAAEDRLGRLQNGTESKAQRVEEEVVAELGGAILLEELGLSREADLGGCYAYLERQCREPAAVLAACDRLLKRTLAAVTLLLDTADELAGRSSAA